MTALDKFKAFDVGAGSLNLWTFRKSERAGSAPTYTGRWIDIAASLEAALKSTIEEDRARIDEIAAYDLLAQTNEASALTIATSATNAGLIVAAAKDEIDGRKARRLKDIQNTLFYSVKGSFWGADATCGRSGQSVVGDQATFGPSASCIF